MKISNNKKTSKKRLAKSCLPAVIAMVPLTLCPLEAKAQLSIVVSGTVDLNFGDLSPNATGGTVTITPGGARTKTGSVILLPGAGLESPATLSMSGSTGVIVEVKVLTPTFTIDDPGLGVPMSVNNFDINNGGSSITITLTTNPGTFPMGATLTVPAGQAQGVYSGTYTIDAVYQ